MCGITGITNFSDKLNCAEKREKFFPQIKKMTESISHRGRDAHCFFVDSSANCFFGHRRLSILDLSDAANQPMHSGDGRFVIVFNGEIYNYKELKTELEKNISFKTMSDTEVLLYSYISWGKECLQKLRGIFAFAIWDNLEKKLFVARDHLGVKPVYYFYDREQQLFAFASELKAMMQFSQVKRKINPQALQNYFQFYSVNPPLTLIQDIYQLEPGCFLQIDKFSFRKERYWNLWDTNYFSSVRHELVEGLPRTAEIKNKIREKLLQTVELQMRSDVSVGAFLSGGLDSTTIVGLMKKFTDQKIHTFNICFGQEGSYLDESQLAKLVAKKFGCQHHELKIYSNIFKNEFNNFIKAIDQPSGDGLNSFFVSKFTVQHVKVALSGHGGDEVFLGYKYFQDLLRWQKFKNNFAGKKLLPLLVNFYNHSRLFRSFAFRSNLNFLKFVRDDLWDSYFAMRSLEPNFADAKLITYKLRKDIPNFFSRAELSWYTPGILLRDTDATSMFSTLEVRVPFLDHEFVELMLQIPSKFKIQLNQKINKPLLANLFDDLLPEQIKLGSKKGFEMPVGFWLQKEFGDDLNKILNVHWLDQKFVKKLLNDFNRNPKNYLKIWSLFVLVNWIEENGVEINCEKEKDFICASWQGVGRSAAESSLSD